MNSNAENIVSDIAPTPIPSAHSCRPDSEKMQHEYFDLPDGQIYQVVHLAAEKPRAAVLICGPAGTERERSYPTMARWARTLASQGFDALRFDYRGLGESSGQFEDMTITDWRDDAACSASRLAQISPGAPIILHGSRAGALIAAELFASGIGDALLLWAPPASGQALLWDTLRRNLATQMVTKPGSPRQTREDLIATLETGELINVDGYFWSHRLWKDAQHHPLVLPLADEPRPWHIVRISKLAPPPVNANHRGKEVHVKTNPFWEDSSMFYPSSDELFSQSLSWLESLEQRNKKFT